MKERAYWEPYPIWLGETVFLIGGGPSLRQYAGLHPEERREEAIYPALARALSPIHGRPVIGINNAYLLGDWVNILTFGDQNWWNKNIDRIRREYAGLAVITSWPNLNIGWGFAKVMRRVYRGFFNDGCRLAWNQCTGHMAVNLAVTLGAAKVVLLGYDGGINGYAKQSKGYWSNWHPAHTKSQVKEKSDQDAVFKRFLAAGRDVKKGCERENVEVIIAGDSAYPFWEKKEISEALHET
jgi:hypothetical protein